MRVLIVAEGAHELAGALENLVRRLWPEPTDLPEFESATVRDSCIHTHAGKGKKLWKRAMAWLREADRRGCDALILLVDEDGDAGRAAQLSLAQEDQRIQTRRALGVAVRTFDAWMLADEAALQQILGCAVNRQSAPERITQPKEVCITLLRNSDQNFKLQEFYAKVATVLAIETLEQRCPQGFMPFARRVRMLTSD